ncbi:hypothetical protein SCLARK_00845 [Spiroplasma clarkii]|uniref:Uncharacterized protein n=1 Tax=Spiroplasma clarkii TaxID=2139 RepID=A0A1Y0L104_9MOLU|nr:hypothetical protein [Spiroplasma clarkii]ARU91460.1 hypothetical protein SCLARK_00845 [Spiroplasma clarkii]ATX70883.1 hypothetical protein SCLAR_v1c05640 [Spiroplasma clarkii]
MKKIHSFVTKLKPYKRLYKIFWMCFTITCLFIFQILMLILAYAVPHLRGSFSYWFEGLYSLLVTSRVEPNSAQGFIFAATVIGYIPIIPIIPFLYFTFANWFIQEKLSDRFIEVPKEDYLKWTKFIHFSILGGLFILIPGLITYAGGGGILPHQAFHAVPGAISEDFAQRAAGVSAVLYYAVGCLFTTIILLWTLGMVLVWVWGKISDFFSYLGDLRAQRKDARLQAKHDKLDSKVSKRKPPSSSGDTTHFDTSDDF